MDVADASELLSREEFLSELSDVYDELEHTLDDIFMYKEENAYTVARRIEELNILMQQMDRFKMEIEKERNKSWRSLK